MTPLLFKSFCDLCEELQKAKKHSEKDTLLSKYIMNYKTSMMELAQQSTNVTPTFYPALRLLVPEFERERGAYGLKETTLAKHFTNALCLDPHSASKLTNYRAGINKRKDDDFAGVAYWVIKRSCPENSKLTIEEVNVFLDTLASQHAQHKPTREIQRTIYKLTKSVTATEMKWIIRIILKDMKLHMGNNRILKIFHEDGPDLYDVCSSLSKVCEVLNDKTKKLHELEISVFTPFRPMLSLKCDSAVFDKEVTDQRLFYIEDKFDGERFQLHMKDHVFKYFSKNGYEYSSKYGTSYDSDGLITPHLETMFKNVRNIILDGEMMGWHKKNRNFGSKGMSYDVKNLNKDTVHRPCFCVFDVVLFNDQVLTRKPLKDRLNILNEVINNIEGVIMRSRIVETTNKEAILNELNKSADNEKEGICFKDPESIYKPNNRNSGWWKMKMEYFEGVVTELDIIIIGGYYGEGRRRGLISSFLLAVAQEPPNPSESPTEFLSFAKIASGFTIDELDKLLSKLKPHWKPVNKNEKPDGILWKKEKSDLWIEPRNSVILQVKASELARSSQFQTEYTLRFPRVDKIRYDKPWYNCMTTKELKELTSSSKPVEKLSDRHINIQDVEGVAKKRRKNTVTVSVPSLQGGQIKSQLFNGKEICIFTGNDLHSVETLEMAVLENGGNIIKVPGPNTFCVVVGDLTTAVHIMKKNNPRDIVTLDWFLRAVEQHSDQILEWSPNDFLNMSENTKQKFAWNYDEYGDSFTQPITREKLEGIFKRIDEKGDYLTLIPQEMTNMDKLLDYQNPLGLFRMVFAYFDNANEGGEELSAIKHDFRFYGGVVCESVTSYTTHIIIHSSYTNRTEVIQGQYPDADFQNIKIVTEKWICKCLTEERKINEESFLV